jgi:adenylate cyclase
MIKNTATEQEFEYPLLANEIRIGRSPEDNELVLNNEKVSRRHAALRRSGKTYTLTDLQSANHTMVNERVITEQELTDGDEIAIGSYRISFINEFAPTVMLQQTALGATMMLRAPTEFLSQLAPASLAADISINSSPEVLVKEINRLRKRSEILSHIYELDKMLNAVFSLDDIFSKVAEVVFRLTQAEHFFVLLKDKQSGEFLPSVIKFRDPDSLEAAGDISLSKTVVDRVVSEQKAMLSTDAAADNRFAGSMSMILRGVHSVICVPLIVQEGVAGVLYMDCQNPIESLTEDDLDLVSALSTTVSMAIDNANLTEQLRKRMERSELMLDMMRSFTAQLERDRLLPVIMQKITTAMNADRSSLFLVDKKTNELFSRIAQGVTLQEIRFPKTAGLAGHVATSGEILNIPDAYDDPRFNQEVDRRTGYRTRSVLGMPVRNNADEIIGVVQVLNKNTGVFTDEDVELLGALSAQAAVALDNSNLFEEVMDTKNFNESILRDMATGVITLNEDGKVTTVNPASGRIFGIAPEEAVGRRYDELLFTEANQDFINNIGEALQSGEKYDGYDIKYNLPEGEEAVSVNVNIVPLKTVRGKSIGQVLVVDDITQEQRMMSTLSRYVGRDVAEQLIVNKQSLKLGGEKRRVTILFSDIRDFTTISEKFDAEEIVTLLNDYFSRMVKVVFHYGGTLDKFIGDAIMAVFGAPIQHTDDPARAVVAAMKMRQELKQFNAERRAKGLMEIEIGIGIGYGEVVSGNIGSDERMDYTVIGDTVNLSSRLEGLTKNYQQKIILSESVYADVKDMVPCVPLESVKVKGKTQETIIYGIDDDAALSLSKTGVA